MRNVCCGVLSAAFESMEDEGPGINPDTIQTRFDPLDADTPLDHESGWNCGARTNVECIGVTIERQGDSDLIPAAHYPNLDNDNGRCLSKMLITPVSTDYLEWQRFMTNGLPTKEDG